MSSSTNRPRSIALWFGLVGFLFGLPLAAIFVFLMLVPSEGLAGNLLVSLLLALVPAALTAVIAGQLARFSRAGHPGFVVGLLAALLAYLLTFILLGVYGADVAGVLATGLHLLLTVPLIWLFPLVAGFTGLLLGRKARRN